MEYTDKEIRLYGVLTKLHFINEDLAKSIYAYFVKGKKEEKMMEIFENQIKISKVLKQIKIPKKFLILNKLEDKDG